MIPFEFHITADENIHNVCTELNIKTIQVELLKPDMSVLRTEHMTSFVKQFQHYSDAAIHAMELWAEINSKSPVSRVKIETPYNQFFVRQSLYIESHFTLAKPPAGEYTKCPLSRTAHKRHRIIGTDRVYNQNQYNDFKERWIKSNNPELELELCLFDSNISEDLDWFSLYTE